MFYYKSDLRHHFIEKYLRSVPECHTWLGVDICLGYTYLLNYSYNKYQIFYLPYSIGWTMLFDQVIKIFGVNRLCVQLHKDIRMDFLKIEFFSDCRFYD